MRRRTRCAWPTRYWVGQVGREMERTLLLIYPQQSRMDGPRGEHLCSEGSDRSRQGQDTRPVQSDGWACDRQTWVTACAAETSIHPPPVNPDRS